MASPDISHLEHLFQLLTNWNLGLLIFAGIIALAIGLISVGIDRTSTQLLYVKDKKLALELKSKDEKIAEAGQQAAFATQRAGDATNSAATANARARQLEHENLTLRASVATLEKQAAEARTKEANAEMLLAEVSKRQGHRRLDIQSLRKAMAGKPKGRCEIVYWPGDPEAREFALQFHRWLGPGVDGDGAGWEVADPVPMPTDMRLPDIPLEVSVGGAPAVHLESAGVSVLLPTSFDGKADTAPGALMLGLMQAGVGNFANRVDKTLAADSVIIVIGPKP